MEIAVSRLHIIQLMRINTTLIKMFHRIIVIMQQINCKTTGIIFFLKTDK